MNTSAETRPWRFCVAPMMDWTTSPCRYFHRLLTRRALLYTEMITAQAIAHGDRQRLLGFDPAERPLALQLGGSEPGLLAAAARAGGDFGYDEINLNVGCPSDRVSAGRFGACLMKEPERVADAVAAMRAAVPLPVTVKTRIGVDEHDGYDALCRLVSLIVAAGCERLIVHARKAWLKGLSPKQNREIPPLRYDVVYRLKRDFPALAVVINGGIADHSAAAAHLRYVDGVMLGRAAYQDPYLLAEVDRRYFDGSRPPAGRDDVIVRLHRRAERLCARGARPNTVTRHVSGLFQGQPGARVWRRYLAEHAHRPGAGADVLLDALAATRRAAAAASRRDRAGVAAAATSPARTSAPAP